MATKYKVKTKAVFNGQPVGSIIELDEAAAKMYAARNYVKIIEEVKKTARRTQSKKSTSATKKTDTSKAKNSKDK